MDPLIQVIVSAVTVVAAVVVAVVVGSRKGLEDVAHRADEETAALISALQGRVALLASELASAKAEIAVLHTEVEALRADLVQERRITARLRTAGQ